MPNIQYQFTLQSEAINSGPYYVVTFASASSLTYYPVLDGSPAYLPNVGSTATVSVPSQSYSFLQFNLNNGSGSCELCNNDVVFLVTGSLPPAPPNTASVSWSLSEYSSSGVYINTDLSIFVNGTGSIYSTSSIGNFTMTASQAVTFSGLNSQPVTFPWPTGSAMYVTASKDNVIFFTGATSDSGSIVSSSFIATSGSVYSISVSSSYTAGAPPLPTGSYNFYYVDQYNCFPCSLAATGLYARTTASFTLIGGHYYNNGDGYVYYVNYSIGGPSYTVDLDLSATAGTNCGLTCAI
jgi:hypothetical protein